MIAYVKGKILSVRDDTAVLVAGGIGYEIACTGEALASLSGKEEGELYTYLSVREDGVTLYGFATGAEKEMFLRLTSVSGVGPKMAISILSGMRLSDLASAIAAEDCTALSRVKGCGKKTAERIVLELREKMADLDLPAGAVSAPRAASKEEDDAVLALMTLGFHRTESLDAVARAVESGARNEEEIISLALRSMNR